MKIQGRSIFLKEADSAGTSHFKPLSGILQKDPAKVFTDSKSEDAAVIRLKAKPEFPVNDYKPKKINAPLPPVTVSKDDPASSVETVDKESFWKQVAGSIGKEEAYTMLQKNYGSQNLTFTLKDGSTIGTQSEVDIGDYAIVSKMFEK